MSSDKNKGKGTKSTAGSDSDGKKSGCTFIFYLGGCCGCEKKIDMRRQTSQKKSFVEVLPEGGVVQFRSTFVYSLPPFSDTLELLSPSLLLSV